jgi:hypothetical protein
VTTDAAISRLCKSRLRRREAVAEVAAEDDTRRQSS